MLETGDQSSKSMTAQQSHEEIQQALRREIDALRKALDARTIQGAGPAGQTEGSLAAAPVTVDALLRKHRLEIMLLHTMYAVARNGPVQGVPPVRKQVDVLTQSALFDPAWYLSAYSDTAQAGMSAAEHYVQSGAFEGRNPGPDFDSMAYYLANPDVAEHGWPALVHYEAFGRAEGRAVT